MENETKTMWLVNREKPDGWSDEKWRDVESDFDALTSEFTEEVMTIMLDQGKATLRDCIRALRVWLDDWEVNWERAGLLDRRIDKETIKE